MPVKKVTPRVKKALLPSPIITETETLVDLSLESKVVPMMAIIASVAMFMAFGSIIAAAAVNMSSMNKPPIPFEASQCADGDNSNVTLDPTQIYPLAGFATAYGSTTVVKNFDPFTASKAICRDTAKYVGYIDQCYKDNYGPLGYISSVAVASCAPTDKRCRVRDGFAYPMISTTTTSTKWAISSWNYLCRNGCMAGACVKDSALDCVDSDAGTTTFPYISGNSDPFIKGTTTGLINGTIVSTRDVCINANQLTEHYCSNNQVVNTGIICDYGCVDGACNRIAVASTTPLYSAAPVNLVAMPNYPPKCSDSDGGKYYYAVGTVTSNNSDGSINIKERCLLQRQGRNFLEITSNGSCSLGDGNCYIEENYCNGGTSGYAYDVRYCPNGCNNGACVKFPTPLYPIAPTSTVTIVNNPPKCTDSDGGKNYYTPGVVVNSTNDPSFSGQIKDSCYIQIPGKSSLQGLIGDCSADNGNCYAQEVYCDSSKTSGYAYDNKYCPNGCSAGACVK